jgi:hypothetical protein
MDHFDAYLQGQKFTLVTDPLPLEELGKVYSETLYRLQKAITVTMLTIFTKKGSGMPAEYLSQNLKNAISWNSTELQQAQATDYL